MSDRGPARTEIAVSGMTCRSCEVKVENAWKRLPGIRSVHADASRGRVTLHADGAAPDRVALAAALQGTGYALSGAVGGEEGRPSVPALVLLFGSVLALSWALGKVGLLNLQANVGDTTGFAAVFLIGLVAASSSCVAVSGGILLSQVGRLRERYGEAPLRVRLRPVVLFVGGRILSYALFGAAIGALGNALTPTPAVAGAITAVAAVYMLVMGLEMLHLAPRPLRALLPRMPKAIAHRVLDAEGRDHPLVPAILGAGTFFLPCGFTQSLQLAALASGSAWAGALMLFAFSLGTAPSLLALGLASGGLRGSAGRWFIRFSGALVVVLGVWNIQNGFTIAGIPLELPSLGARDAAASGGAVRMEDGRQVVDVDARWEGYAPDFFRLQAGVPAVIRVTGEAAVGCASVFTIPRLRIRDQVRPDAVTEIAFTPTVPGIYPFSCSMGMLKGRFEVVKG